MKSYYRVRLGEGGAYVEECLANDFIGTDFGVREDLTARLAEGGDSFKERIVQLIMGARPGKTRQGAGLNAGSLWTVSKAIEMGDLILAPEPSSRVYHAAEVTGDYFYQPDGVLPHRRPVTWLGKTIDRDRMSESLRGAAEVPLTAVSLGEYADDIESLLGGSGLPTLVSRDPSVEDPYAFAMEEHLEHFLVKNWRQTGLGAEYDIFEDGERTGKQFVTDTGKLDILAVSKDKKKLLVVELKKGRAPETVVGQLLRYMGFVHAEMAKDGQSVEGLIIALEDDLRIRRAISVVPRVRFYRYSVSFKLIDAEPQES